MKGFFSPNIGARGRIARALTALALVVAAVYAFTISEWIGFGLCVLAAFALFEALRGWCVLRACGIKTRI